MDERSKLSTLMVLVFLLILIHRSNAEMSARERHDDWIEISQPKKGVTNFTCLERKNCIAKTPAHWWVGTDGGLVRLNEETLGVERIYTTADGLSGTRVVDLAYDGDELWVGAYHGISRIDPDTDTIRTMASRGGFWRFELDDSTGDVWALSREEVLLYEKGSNRTASFVLGEDTVNVWREEKVLWAVARRNRTDYELIRWDCESEEITTHSLQSPDAGYIGRLIIGKRELWITGESRSRFGVPLFRIDKQDFEVTPQGVATGLAHDSIEQLVSSDTDVWVRTAGNGERHAQIPIEGRLCRFDRKHDRWETLPSISGFKYDEPTWVAELNGDLWVATRAYERTEKKVIGWGMMPLEGEAPVLEALTLNRFLPEKQAWQTFTVSPRSDFERIIDMVLFENRLWFLIARQSIAQSWEELGTSKSRSCVISGYLDLGSTDSNPVLLDNALLPWPGLGRWPAREAMDLLVTGERLWVRHRDDFWRRTTEGTWQELEFESALPECRWLKLFTANGNTLAAFTNHTFRFDSEAGKWLPWGIGPPWTVMHTMKDAGGTWWLSAATGRVHLPDDSERNDEDRNPVQSGLFRSKDGVAWQVPSIAPWTWHHQNIEGEVRFLPSEEVKRSPHDLDLWGMVAKSGPRIGARRSGRAKAGEGISCVQSDGDRVWVGTFGEGVFCLEKNRWRRLWPKSASVESDRGYLLPRDPGDIVVSMALDGDSLWIATMAGLCRYRLPEDKIETVERDAVGINELPQDLSSMEPENIVSYGPVVAKAAGRIWFSPHQHGENEGVYCFREDKKRWECVIPDMNGRCFAESGDTVWIGTREGLLRYDTKSKAMRVFGPRDGLVSEYVQSLAVDHQSVWVGAVWGISRLDRKTFGSSTTPAGTSGTGGENQ